MRFWLQHHELAYLHAKNTPSSFQRRLESSQTQRVCSFYGTLRAPLDASFRWYDASKKYGLYIMTTLTFTLKQNPAFKLNCGRLTPNNLAGLSLADINNLTLLNDKNAPKVADFFEVTGSNAEHITFKNSNQQLDYIGHNMTHGQITIENNCGDFLGANMQNGSIICQGNVGDRAGDQMRRGLILIDGNAGDYLASRMIAGTIGVLGKVGTYAGFGMKRGTLLLTQTPTLHTTLQDCGAHTLPFLSLLFKSFAQFNTPFSAMQSQRVQRFVGDAAVNGNGEILLMQSTVKF